VKTAWRPFSFLPLGTGRISPDKPARQIPSGHRPWPSWQAGHDPLAKSRQIHCRFQYLTPPTTLTRHSWSRSAHPIAMQSATNNGQRRFLIPGPKFTRGVAQMDWCHQRLALPPAIGREPSLDNPPRCRGWGYRRRGKKNGDGWKTSLSLSVIEKTPSSFTAPKAVLHRTATTQTTVRIRPRNTIPVSTMCFQRRAAGPARGLPWSQADDQKDRPSLVCIAHQKRGIS